MRSTPTQLLTDIRPIWNCLKRFLWNYLWSCTICTSTSTQKLMKRLCPTSWVCLFLPAIWGMPIWENANWSRAPFRRTIPLYFHFFFLCFFLYSSCFIMETKILWIHIHMCQFSYFDNFTRFSVYSLISICLSFNLTNCHHLKVSKSQKQFFWNSISQKTNKIHIWPKSALAS